ncbi:phage minor structural protein, partial [gut metagenome]
LLDPSKQIVIEDPKLELEDSSAGSFTFTIYSDHPAYKLIDSAILTGVVSVYWDDEVLYKGRIISAEKDFVGGRYVETEGEMAFLSDTIQRPAEYHEPSVRSYLSKLLDAHNAQVGPEKQFQVGAVTVTNGTEQVYKYTNWESTLKCIQEDLLDTFGGHLRVRYANGVRYLDYLKDWPRLSAQRIEFGENLLDYSESTNAMELATVVIPLGERQKEKDIKKLEKRLTIASINQGKDYIELPEAIKRYGRIVRTLICDKVTTPETLKKRGEEWLKNNQYEELELTLSAVDLADFGVNTDHLRLLDRIRCTSKPHGLDREFGLTAVSLSLMNPDQNSYTLGSKQKGFSKGVAQSQYQMLEDLNNQPTESHVLAQALDNATQLITMCGKDGHVLFSPSIANPNELYITDYNTIDEARRCWRWNLNGLGYSSNGKNGPFDLAITMDGTIAGKFIAAGTVGADQIDVQYTQNLDSKLQTGLKNTADSIKMWASNELG